MEVLKLTLENVKKIKNESSNALTKGVCDYVIRNGDNFEDKTRIFLDIMEYGCRSGVCNDLYYCEQTARFYNTYKHEINELLYESDYVNLSDLSEFNGDGDNHDPLALEEDNQNLLAWFGFEETIANIARKFGIE